MASTIEERISALETRVAALEHLLQSGANEPTLTNKHQSLREYINTKGPRTANDKGLVIAHYLEVIRGAGAFNINDLRAGFMEAKLPMPRNMNDMVNKNISKGLLMQSGTKGGVRSWVLTNSGEITVEKGFEA